jgi:hypothetical protein
MLFSVDALTLLCSCAVRRGYDGKFLRGKLLVPPASSSKQGFFQQGRSVLISKRRCQLNPAISVQLVALT